MAEPTTEAPEQVQDTPETTDAPAPESQDTPVEGTDTPEEVDYRKRYDDLRPEYDRSQQLIAALEGRQGPEAQRAAYERFGLSLVDDEDEESDEDEYLDPDERINRLEQRLEEQQREAQERELQELESQWIENELEGVAKAEGRDLADEEKEIIIAFALANRHEDGRPDIEGGHKRLEAIYSQARKRLVDSKRNAPKPPDGVAGETAHDLTTPEGRRAAIIETAEASFTSE